MFDKNDIAKGVFEEIRDLPYRGSIYPDRAWNCYFKGLKLVENLVALGFTMRARVGETHWKDTPIPDEIVALIPDDSLETHYYPEILLDGEWKILDPSWNKPFAEKFGLPYSEFGADNQSCFKVTKLFDEEEQAEYISNWICRRNEDREYRRRYKKFINAMNEWLEEVNP